MVSNWEKVLVVNIFTCLLLGPGCSHHSVGNKQNFKGGPAAGYEFKKNKPAPGAPQQSYELAKIKIQKLKEAAKKKGIYAQNYLANDLYLKADLSAREGDTLTAIFLYKNLLSMYPQDYFLKKKYAIELVKNGQMKEGRELFESIYTHDKGKDENSAFILAGLYINDKMFKKARRIYNKILIKNPKNVEACIFKSKSFEKKFLYKWGVKTLRNCAQQNPAVGIYSYYIGKIYLEKNMMNKALVAFKKAVKKSPDFYQATLAIGLIYEEKDEMQKAVKAYKKYLKLDEGNKTILSRLVNVLFSESKYQEVVPYAEKLILLDQHDLNLKVKLGILYSDAKKYDKAINIFKKLLKAVPDSDKIIYYLGSIYQEINKFDEAIEYFSKIPSSSALFLDGHIQVAEMLQSLALKERKTGKNEDYRNKFLSFTESTGNKNKKAKVAMQVLRANFFESIEKIDLAIEELERVEKNPEFNENQRYYLAVLYEKLGNSDRAFEIMYKVLEDNPQNAHVLNFIGYSYLERGTNLDKAYEYINKAVTLLPDDGFIRDSLGWYFYQVGNYELALKELKIAREKVSNDVVISKHLGLIYQKLNNRQLAKKYFNEAMRNSTRESEKREFRHLIDQLAEKNRLPAGRDKNRNFQ